MGNRNPLRGHLIKAWHETLMHAYCEQLINTERGLQVHFCMALLPLLEKHGPRKLFVEPHVRVGKGVCIPDLVICNNRQVIGIVELKYKPRAKATKALYDKDVGTLKALMTPRDDEEEVVIENKRYLGAGKGGKAYTIAKDAVLCWAGVYRGTEAWDVFASIGAEDRKRFLALHGLTRPDGGPTSVPPGA